MFLDIPESSGRGSGGEKSYTKICLRYQGVVRETDRVHAIENCEVAFRSESLYRH